MHLLDVQELDRRADQLRHQRATLPELAELERLAAERREVDGQVRDAQIAVDDLTAEQDKIESDVAQVRTRRDRDQQRIDAGQVSNPKDLQRMQHEMESLLRRVSDLEDEELEVMAKLEDAERTLTELRERAAELDQRRVGLEDTRDRALAEIDESLRQVEADRAPAAEGLPAELLALYDRLRAAKGGVGAAALRARRCEGCMLTVDNAELGVIRAAADDEVLRCEECQRILVRTAESGL